MIFQEIIGDILTNIGLCQQNNKLNEFALDFSQ
jgi:hypothetical protein